MMEIQFWAQTDVGRVREHNEDNFLVDKRLQLFVVCDGMGGHAAGEVASAVCVQAVREAVVEQRELVAQIGANPDDPMLRRQILQLLEHAVHSACARIYHMGQEDKSKLGMGTTCVLILLTQTRGFIAHVGDSRAYLVRRGQVHQMTEDHSLYNEMVRMGKIRPGEQVNLPNKNAVTRAVGVRETVEVDVLEFDTLAGDRFLLCSDGLSGYIKSEEQLLALLYGDELQAVAERCITHALEAGGRDNITAILIQVPETAEELMQSEELQVAVETIKSTPYFQYLAGRDIHSILELACIQEVEAGERVIDPSHAEIDLYIVMSGKLRRTLDGISMGSVTTGDHFGELAFLDGQLGELEVIAEQASVLLVIQRQPFMELLRRDAEMGVKLMWNFLQIFTFRLRQGLQDRFDLQHTRAQLEESSRTTTAVDVSARADKPASKPDDYISEDMTPPAGGLVVPEAALNAAAELAFDEDTPDPDAPQDEDEELVLDEPIIPTPAVMVGHSEPESLAEPTENPIDDDEEDDHADLEHMAPRPALVIGADDQQNHDEDLRATIELDWMNSRRDEPTLPAIERPPLMRPPAPSGPLPSLSVPRPKAPERPMPPIGKGISGESVVAPDVGSTPAPAAMSAPAPAPARPPPPPQPTSAPAQLLAPPEEMSLDLGLPSADSAPALERPAMPTITPLGPTDPMELSSVPSLSAPQPPKALIMRRRKKRGDGLEEGSLVEGSLAESSFGEAEERPRFDRGLSEHSTNPIGMRAHSAPSGEPKMASREELSVTMQLDQDELDFLDEETHQMRRPSREALKAEHERQRTPTDKPSPTVEVNLGDPSKP
jgi:serine/threonine protein phosphatase PrpC